MSTSTSTINTDSLHISVALQTIDIQYVSQLTLLLLSEEASVVKFSISADVVRKHVKNFPTSRTDQLFYCTAHA